MDYIRRNPKTSALLAGAALYGAYVLTAEDKKKDDAKPVRKAVPVNVELLRNSNVHFDEEFDVVVVGSGAAGISGGARGVA